MRRALAGAGLGLLLGIAARVWMRMIATEPELTWAGTGVILGAFTVAGLGVGVAAAARAQGRSPWWRLALLLAVPVFLSPGMVLAPAFVVGGWGLRRQAGAPMAAVASVLVAPVVLVTTGWDEVQRTLLPLPVAVYLAVLGGGAAALGGALAWAGSAVLAPWSARQPSAGEGSTTRRRPAPRGERAAGARAV